MVGGNDRQPLPHNRANIELYMSTNEKARERHFQQSNIDSSESYLLLFLRSVAAWFDAPDTQFLLDFIRPDFLLLRVSCLILVARQDKNSVWQTLVLIMSARLNNFNQVLISIKSNLSLGR